jgi:stearoyl-CoA desaturase (Delta-9 desaturase)
MFDGFLNLSIWGYLAAALILTHVTIASVTIFLHRHQAHRALALHPALSHFFRFWLWLTTGMVTKEWVAVHRKHHAKCETEEDPHSPQIVGINRVLWGGVLLYKKEAANPETLEKYGLGTPDDWLEERVYTVAHTWGIMLMLAIDIALFGLLAGPIIWGVQMVWIPFWAAGVINGLGHYWGYRSFEVPDASTNIVPWGVLIGGEEMHNNHHAFASSAKFSSKWWEFDVGWLYIRVFELLGLARVKKVAPIPVINPAKQAVDRDTLLAIISNRFQVLAHYGRYVIIPVLKEEIQRGDDQCRRMYKRARAWLVRDESLVNEASRRMLEAILEANSRLKTVYQFKQRLQTIWGRSAATPEALLQSLQDWCKQAEATGIKALQEFARTLRGYTLQTA